MDRGPQDERPKTKDQRPNTHEKPPFTGNNPNGQDDDNFVQREAANRTVSPSADAVEGSPGHLHAAEVEGQLGPDELPDPDEVVMNQEAKLHH
jgi:hypothetical protein